MDGPGIRFVIFLQGCPLQCKFCHNPDSWDFAYGKKMDVDFIMEQILSYRNFIKNGGVTISGGEPMMQPEFVKAILDRCREHGVHTAIDTSGAVALNRCKEVIDAADMLLLDIKDIDSDDCRKLTGMGNENAFAVLDYCESIHKPIWIRHVVVPTLTLHWDKLERLANKLSQYSWHFRKLSCFRFIKWESISGKHWDVLMLWRIFNRRQNSRWTKQKRFSEIVICRYNVTLLNLNIDTEW